jgi:hypothetical protein
MLLSPVKLSSPGAIISVARKSPEGDKAIFWKKVEEKG